MTAQSQVHAGSGRASSGEPRTAPLGLDAHFARIHDGLDAIYSAALAAMTAAGPLPIAGSEVWVERGEAYRERLRDALGPMVDLLPSRELDWHGRGAGLLRARLVRAED